MIGYSQRNLTITFTSWYQEVTFWYQKVTFWSQKITVWHKEATESIKMKKMLWGPGKPNTLKMKKLPLGAFWVIRK